MSVRYLAVTTVTALALVGCGKSAHRTGASGPPQVGEPAPEIAGTDLDGRSFKLTDYRGKVVMLDFWKTY
jgi:cytochrome oxidase Cu insertion factor (SCO1/SenC/PrrC family)